MSTPVQHSGLSAAEIDALTLELVARLGAVTARSPWTRVSPELRAGYLLLVLHALIAVTFGQGGLSLQVRCLVDAHLHGRDRRACGFGEEVVLHEYHLLQTEAAQLFRTRYGPRTAVTMSARLDPLIAAATAVSLRGYQGLDLHATAG